MRFDPDNKKYFWNEEMVLSEKGKADYEAFRLFGLFVGMLIFKQLLYYQVKGKDPGTMILS